MKKMTLTEVLETIESKASGYYGFRGASERDLEILASGHQYLDASLDLWDSRDCNYRAKADRLPGTSAIAISEYDDCDDLEEWALCAKGYADNQHKTGVVLFLHGDDAADGSDPDEIVLRCDFEDGAQVLAEVVL